MTAFNLSRMAMAAAVTVAQVIEMVTLGFFHPDQVHTQGIFVDRVVVADQAALGHHQQMAETADMVVEGA